MEKKSYFHPPPIFCLAHHQGWAGFAGYPAGLIRRRHYRISGPTLVIINLYRLTSPGGVEVMCPDTPERMVVAYNHYPPFMEVRGNRPVNDLVDGRFRDYYAERQLLLTLYYQNNSRSYP